MIISFANFRYSNSQSYCNRSKRGDLVPGKWISRITQNIQTSNNQVIIIYSNGLTEWLHTVNTHHFRNISTDIQILVHCMLISDKL